MLSPTRLLFIAFLSLTATTQFATADEPPMPTVTVTGTATVNVVPDEAVLTVSLESRDKNLDSAVTDNGTKMKAVIEFLKQSGVEDKFIRTQVINIRPIYPDRSKGWKPAQQAVQQVLPMPNTKPNDEEFSQIKPIGYSVSRQLAITIRKLDSFESVYRGLISRGVNVVSGIKFQTTELRKHKDDARLKAIRAAREKATALASELGAKLVADRLNRGQHNRNQRKYHRRVQVGRYRNGAMTAIAQRVPLRI